MLSETPQPIFLKDYQPPSFLIDRADLDFELGEASTRVYARLTMRRNPAAVVEDKGLRLDGERLKLISVALNGERLSSDAYRVDQDSLRIEDVPVGFTLETLVEIDPAGNTALEGLYKTGGMFCTQCEAEGFRRITYYLDRPDVMARFTTSITADRARYPVLLSNGNPVEEVSLADGRHKIRWEDPYPKPCYLFALVAGDLRSIEDRYVTASGREVTLRIYVEPENIDKCAHAMTSLKKAMRWDEQTYGREYDLDIYMIVAVNDFNMGAMENKGLNVFNSKYVLARPESATDRDFRAIEGVVAHEYFHNWTGNRITCRDWFQLSLKEGLTVFRDEEFSSDMGSRGVKRIEDVRVLRAHQFAEDAGPMAHPVRPPSYIEINNFYTVTVYNKGAEVVRMQRNLLGAEGFRLGMDLYFERHDGEAVTTDDFVACMEDANARDLTQFHRWYDQAGTPVLDIETDYDPDGRSFRLRITQSCPATPGQLNKLPLHIPVAIGLLDTQGRDLALQLQGDTSPGGTTRVLELTQPSQTWQFTNIEQPPVISLLRGFSAPVKVRYEYSESELMFLMAHDSDDFNRWDAAQSLAQRVLLRMIEDYRAGRPMQAPEGFFDAFNGALEDRAADKSLIAEVLTLPSESYLGEQLPCEDVEAVHAAREALQKDLAGVLKDSFLRCYEANRERGEYAVDPASVGRRALKNRCLYYLMCLDDAEVRQLCMQQFRDAHNMTDVLAALTALANCDCPEREQALQAFERQWRDDPLVLDKWFAIQAVSKLPGVLKQVESLQRHPAFSIRNPNKVRSLIGAFCTGNVVAFHAQNGAGYRYLADRVLEIDTLNPQVAARLVLNLIRWRRYDAVRQGIMKQQLQRILAAADLSRDVFEVASRALETK